MWARWPEVLKNYAKHYKTGEPIPQPLVDKVQAAEKFNQGFQTTEYLAASLLDQAWHQFNPSDIVPCTHDAEENLRLLEKILSRRDRPDAIIASVEKLAVQVYQACRSLGLNIPGDLKVIGFSNLATASLLYPSMTTVTQPAFEMGKEAATLLFRALGNKSFSLSQNHHVIPSELQVRDSTG